MNPKISDFGLARIFGRDQTQAVTSRVVGTYGYMAPEYMMRGNYSVKSDAFSFGVMVLEIVTGRKNSNDGCDLLTTGMDALGGRDGGGAGRTDEHGRQFPGGRRAEVHPHRPLVRPARPCGPTSDVVGRHDARQRHGHPPGSVQAGILRQEQQRLHNRVDSAGGCLAWP
ncbi:Cysteine-rich receptor-like protein kinase 10 [Zea mays]|uniref:Cysteine-rich receptor-like protein kinase 10 n=1 Tax=Zea mays TaxID=4577 RepID=A0A1D6IE34_MAIZE|nr:Cysteine-rich receptor-like protein kinase 10 [Zea mays]